MLELTKVETGNMFHESIVSISVRMSKCLRSVLC
jgi:hypothetical protein